MKVVVVLPAYNEGANLPALLPAIDRHLALANLPYRTIVVDDGSTDDTQAVLATFATHMPLSTIQHSPNQGLGATLRDGLTQAMTLCEDDDVVVVLDADNSQPAGLIPRLVQLVCEGNDVAIASRYRAGARQIGVPFPRLILSFGARVVFQICFPTRGVRDYTCGFRAYSARMLKRGFATHGSDFVSQAGFQCMVDVLLKLRGLGAVFCEAPMVLRYDQKIGASKMQVMRTVTSTLRLLLRLRFSRS